MNYRHAYKIANPANAGGWYQCTYCDKSIRFRNAEVDHIWPQNKGGTDQTWNLVIACQSCNRSKSNKIDGRVVKGVLVKIFR